MKTKIAHADEIGTKVNGSNHWIHSFSNENFTVLTSHKNRGKKAIVEAEILPNFHRILTHDCWYAYDYFNNAAEREIRNIKIKSKIQGAFRSDLGSEIYCRVRGYIATMKKNEQNQYETLKSIFELCDIMVPIINQKGETA